MLLWITLASSLLRRDSFYNFSETIGTYDFQLLYKDQKNLLVQVSPDIYQGHHPLEISQWDHHEDYQVQSAQSERVDNIDGRMPEQLSGDGYVP
jgi:hypothetical protein